MLVSIYNIIPIENEKKKKLGPKAYPTCSPSNMHLKVNLIIF
jgi:hypothetical protein